ncbi:MAG: ribosomal protein L7/L12 [Aeoliella sp.]
MNLTDESRDQINEAIFAGRKIEAIKLYREATGEGLKEAKDFIEGLTVRLREEYPDKLPAKAAGCGSTVLLIVTASAALVGWWVC